MALLNPDTDGDLLWDSYPAPMESLTVQLPETEYDSTTTPQAQQTKQTQSTQNTQEQAEELET